jgi:hypothetical protein
MLNVRRNISLVKQNEIKFRVIQKDGPNFVWLYFLNHIYCMWVIYITFERGGSKVSNTTATALA